jgi:hypothetical protein
MGDSDHSEEESVEEEQPPQAKKRQRAPTPQPYRFALAQGALPIKQRRTTNHIAVRDIMSQRAIH